MVKTRKKKHLFARPLFWIIILLVSGGVGAGWYFWRSFFERGAQFHALIIQVNQEPKRIAANETLLLHPGDRARILEILTNIPFNHDLRLVSPELDIGALRFEELPVASLLPERNVYDHYRFEVFVKYRNATIGSVVLDVRPFLEDWVDKAVRTISSEERVSVLQKALGFHPGEKTLMQCLIETYKETGQWRKAAGTMERMNEGTRDPSVLREICDLYSAAGDSEAVIRLLGEITEQDPADISALRELAGDLDRAGRTEESVRYYEALLGLIPEEEGLPVHSRLALIHAEAGRHQAAIGHYLQIARHQPDDPNLYYNLAYLHEKAGQAEASHRYLEKALLLNDRDREGRLKLAHHLVEQEQWTEAKRRLEEVLAIDPKDQEGLLLLAQVLEKLGDEQALAEIYSRIAALDPQNDTVRFNLGVIEYQSGELEEALVHLTAFAERHPEDVSAQTILFDLHRRMENMPQAVQTARTLIRLQPENIAAYSYLFETLHDQKDYNGLVEILEPAVDANPKEQALRQYLLVAFVELGREDRAMTTLEGILDLDPKNHELWLHLARLREKNQDLKGAMEAYRQVLQLVPQHEEASEAFLRLRLLNLDASTEQ